MFPDMYHGPWRKQDTVVTIVATVSLLAMQFVPLAQILRVSLCWAGVPNVEGCTY